MNTLLLLVFYPAVAMLVYTLLVIRGMYLRQARNNQESPLSFIQWIATTTRMRSRRRYLIYLLVLMMAIMAILTILILYPFNN